MCKENYCMWPFGHPGDPVAVGNGCECPMTTNNFGKGTNEFCSGSGAPLFDISPDCPMHNDHDDVDFFYFDGEGECPICKAYGLDLSHHES